MVLSSPKVRDFQATQLLGVPHTITEYNVITNQNCLASTDHAALALTHLASPAQPRQFTPQRNPHGQTCLALPNRNRLQRNATRPAIPALPEQNGDNRNTTNLACPAESKLTETERALPLPTQPARTGHTATHPGIPKRDPPSHGMPYLPCLA